jgi:hypothetical protein
VARRSREPNVQTIVIPRDPEPIVLTAQAVLDYESLRQAVPSAHSADRDARGGVKTADTQGRPLPARPRQLRPSAVAWIVLESLRLGTPELEFDKVDMGNPNTWDKYLDELKDSGFSWAEIEFIIDGCMTANALNEDKLEEAR